MLLNTNTDKYKSDEHVPLIQIIHNMEGKMQDGDLALGSLPKEA